MTDVIKHFRRQQRRHQAIFNAHECGELIDLIT